MGAAEKKACLQNRVVARDDTVWIVVPTYNEALTIGGLLDDLDALGRQYHVLVVDDDSPDRTAEVAESFSAAGPMRTHVLCRRGSRSRAHAGTEGMRYALARGAEVLVEMDADGSHPPEVIPRLVEEAVPGTVAIASRKHRQGSDLRGSVARRLLTSFAARFICLLFGLRLTDPTSGYRAFPADVLRRVPWRSLVARGPAIVEELFVVCRALGARFVEIGYAFQPRAGGQSKLTVLTLLRVCVDLVRVRMRVYS